MKSDQGKRYSILILVSILLLLGLLTSLPYLFSFSHLRKLALMHCEDNMEYVAGCLAEGDYSAATINLHDAKRQYERSGFSKDLYVTGLREIQKVAPEAVKDPSAPFDLRQDDEEGISYGLWRKGWGRLGGAFRQIELQRIGADLRAVRHDLGVTFNEELYNGDLLTEYGGVYGYLSFEDRAQILDFMDSKASDVLVESPTSELNESNRPLPTPIFHSP